MQLISPNEKVKIHQLQVTESLVAVLLRKSHVLSRSHGLTPNTNRTALGKDIVLYTLYKTKKIILCC